MDAEAFSAIFETTPLFKQLERHVAAGDYSVFESQATRQHFIPRFFLARFAHGQGRVKYVFQLDVHSGKPQRIQPKHAASEFNFYAVLDEEGNHNNRIEGFLALVENHAAPALGRLLDDLNALTEADRATLAYFFALLNARTPGATTRGAATADTMMRMLYASGFSDDASFARKYREQFGDETDENIEEFRRQMLDMLKTGEVGFADPRTAALQLTFSVSGEIASHIFEMDWTLLTSKAALFVTSDRGLAMVDPEPPFPWTGSAWRSSPRAQTTIPLSSSVCLRVEPDDTAKLEVADVGADVVGEINLRTYGWAGDYIYGETQDAVVCIRRGAKQHPSDIPRSRPNYQVVVLEADPYDTTLAEEHLRRGWPPYLPVDGEPHDYYVIGLDGEPVETMERTTEIVKQRARRQLGLRDDEPLPGEPGFDPVSLG